MQRRFVSFILLSVLVFAGCSLDYNDYPYATEETDVGTSLPASSLVEEEPTDSTLGEVEPVDAESSVVENTTTEVTTETTTETSTVTSTAAETPVVETETASVATEETTSSTETPVEVQAPVSETKTFTVSASQFSFNPSTITVNKGDTVVINFSTDDVAHGFALSEFNLTLTATTPGEVVTGSFVADQAGTFSFFCNVSCGSGHGSMRGTFIVNDV